MSPPLCAAHPFCRLTVHVRTVTARVAEDTLAEFSTISGFLCHMAGACCTATLLGSLAYPTLFAKLSCGVIDRVLGARVPQEIRIETMCWM